MDTARIWGYSVMKQQILDAIDKYGYCEMTWDALIHIWPDPDRNDYHEAIEIFAGLPDRKSSLKQFEEACEKEGLEWERNDEKRKMILRRKKSSLKGTQFNG